LDRHSITLTHEDKVLFPKVGLTKRDLIEYYRYISPVILPYLYNRPLSLYRFVSGLGSKGFFQKDTPAYFPSWIRRVPIEKSDGTTTNYVLANNAATLIYLANQDTIEFHPSLSRIDKLHYPDRMIFDLDPAGKSVFALVVWTAWLIKDVLDTLKLPSFVMTTGSRGLHVLVPLKRRHTFDQVREFAKKIAGHLVVQHPTKLTNEMRIANRGNRIFIDAFRNGLKQTAIVPYCVRARPYASVAMPLHWHELEDKKLTSDYYTIQTAPKRIDKLGDIWADIQKEAVSLSYAIKQISFLCY
jgi:bifunctional non-homologous end joining protein LigD